MSNAFSRAHNFAEELYRPNSRLIAEVLRYKQAKYDSNHAKLETIMGGLEFMDIAKDGDKEYAENRLKQAKSIVDQYQLTGDLGDTNLSIQLKAKLGEVLDDNVKNALTSTAIYRSEQKAWNDLKMKSPDKYSDVNRAYAQRASNAWLQSEGVGEVYNGGGGPIEYRDVFGKFMDNLPKIEKALKAKYIQEGPGAGHFKSLDTYEVIPKDALNNVLNGLYDQNDQRQMQIDAWGKYDRATDEQLKEAYDDFYGAKLSTNKDNLAANKLLLAKTSDPQQKQQIQSAIAVLEDNITDLENSTFENVVGTYGREAAYTSLHTNSFRDGLLETFTKPSFVERKLDQASKENAKYQLDLLELQEKHRHNLATEEVSRFNALNKGSKGGTGTGTQGTPNFAGNFEEDAAPVVAGDVEVGYSSSEETGTDRRFIDEMWAREDEAYNGVIGLVEGVGATSEALMDPEVLGQLKTLEGRSQIVLERDANGEPTKTISVADNFEALDAYRRNVVNDSEAKKRSRGQIGEFLTDMRNTLIISDKYGDDIDIDDALPAYNFVLYKGKGKGNVTLKKLNSTSNKKGQNMYAELLRGNKGEYENLMQEETLQLYQALHLYHDKNLSNSERRMAKNYLINLLKDYPKEVRDQIDLKPVNYGGSDNIPNSNTKLYTVSDQWISEYDKGDLDMGIYNDNLIVIGSDYAKKIEEGTAPKLKDPVTGKYVKKEGGLSAYIYHANLGRAIVSNASGGRFKGARATSGLDTKMGRVFKAIEDELAPEFVASQQGLVSSKKLAYQSDNTDYPKIRALAGIKDVKYKDDIIIEQEIVNGVPTENAKITFNVENDDKEKIEAEPVIINKTNLPIGLQKTFMTSSHTYDAARGQGAPKIELGSNTFDEYHIKSTQKATENNEFVLKQTNDYIKELGDKGGPIIKYISDGYFNRGRYDFKLEPINGSYHIVMRDDRGKTLHTSNTNLQIITDEHRKAFYQDPSIFTDVVYSEYITKRYNYLLTQKNQSEYIKPEQ